jgi:predicted amidohydrolase YtcJ
MCSLADSCGYQVNTHCIGDAANHEILTIYAGFLHEKNDKRWRIEHAQVIATEDFAMFGKYSIIPSIQATHATSDMYWAVDRLGENRIVNAYAYKKLLDQNGWLPNGSDFPVEDINPLYGFFAAFARKDKQMFPAGGFQTNDSLCREDALKAMTIWAAKAAFEENEKGSIEPGKLADFVVCKDDIMTVPADMTFKVRVEQTFISGELVFSR